MTKVIYVKASVERRPEYRQQTIILEENGHRVVRKIAVGAIAQDHVNAYLTNADILKKAIKPDGRICIASCEKKAEGIVEFPFIWGISLEDRLKQSNAEGYLHELLAFIQMIETSFEMESFKGSAGFTELFGQSVYPEGKMSLMPANIDMNFGNIFFSPNNTLTIIDYEWVKPFLVPLDFIIFRSLISDLTYSQFKKEEQAYILSGIGISEKDREMYWEMEKAFQYSVAQDRDKLDFFLEKGTIRGNETISMESLLSSRTEAQQLAHDLKEYQNAYDRQQEAIQKLDHDLNEYRSAYDRQQEAIQKLDHDLNEYRSAYDRQQEMIQNLDLNINRHKRIHDKEQQESKMANQHLSEQDQKNQQLSKKWFNRLLNWKK